MQRFSPLRVAIKDRPKIFQVIVFGLFSFSLFVIVAFVALHVKGNAGTPVTAQAKKNHTPPAESDVVPVVATVRR